MILYITWQHSLDQESCVFSHCHLPGVALAVNLHPHKWLPRGYAWQCILLMEICTGSICFLARHPVTSCSSYYCLQMDTKGHPCDNRLWDYFGWPQRGYWRFKFPGMDRCVVRWVGSLCLHFWCQAIQVSDCMTLKMKASDLWNGSYSPKNIMSYQKSLKSK